LGGIFPFPPHQVTPTIKNYYVKRETKSLGISGVFNKKYVHCLIAQQAGLKHKQVLTPTQMNEGQSQVIYINTANNIMPDLGYSPKPQHRFPAQN